MLQLDHKAYVALLIDLMVVQVTHTDRCQVLKLILCTVISSNNHIVQL